MKNKIAIIESGFLYEYFYDFSKLCKANDIDIDIITLGDNIIHHGFANNVFYLNYIYNSKDIKNIKELEAKIKKVINIEDYDYILSDCLALSFTSNIFHGHSLARKIDRSYCGFLKFLIKLFYKKRLLHDKSYYKNSPKSVVVSRDLKSDLVQNYLLLEDKVFVAYPGTSNKCEVIRKKNTVFTIGLSACGFATKGGYNLLGAVRVLKKKYSDFAFQIKIINPKFEKNSFLDFYLKLFKLENNVEFLPYQFNMGEFYSSIDCLVCASRYETFGRVVTEAMLNKIPVIVGSNIGASEVIEDGVNGFIFNYDKNRYENLADKIVQVYESKSKINSIIQNAKILSEDLTWENFAKTVFGILYKNYDS